MLQNRNFDEECPLVSVGLPTRNRAHLLKEALDSLLNQTYENIEYIISDNASTDGTEDLLRAAAAHDPRIRSVRQKTDINGMENHEFVLREARGKYFMWASDDDWWDPRFVETLVHILEKNPDYGVAMSYYYKKIVHESGSDAGGGDAVIREVRHDFTPLGHQELYRIYLRGRATHIFFFGLYRTALLKKIFTRKSPWCFNGLTLTLSEVALATRSWSVPEFLHRQLQDARLHTVRHPTNPYTVGELEPFAVTRYAITIPWWLLTSPAIPWTRKHLIIRPWLARAWLYKRKMAREIWRFLRYSFFPSTAPKIDVDDLLDEWLASVNYVTLANVLFLIRRSAGKNKEGVLERIDARKRIIEEQEVDRASADQITKLVFLETYLKRT